MQNKLQELTDKLYKEGLSKGKQEGEEILAKAKDQAEEIIGKAKAEAEAIIAAAQKEAEDLRTKVTGDLKMAAGQSVAATRQDIETLIITKMTEGEISSALTSADFVKQVILAVAKGFNAQDAADLELVLPESLKKELEPFVAKELATVLNGGVQASFSKKISGGFNIGPKDGGYFISFTDETFKALIAEYLRPATKKASFRLSFSRGMNNYEYIIASLPDISQDWKFGETAPQDYIDWILEQCSRKDRKTIGFMLDGLDDGKLDAGFYEAALSHDNRFIREYFSFDLNVRNAKVRYLNTALGRPAEKDAVSISVVKTEEEFPEAIAVESVLALTDILAREKGLDDLMWNKIDSITLFNYFDINVILGFIAKLHIVARWYRLDEQTGREMFRKLVDEVRGTFKGVEYESA